MYPSAALLAQGFPVYCGVGCSASAANPDFASTSFHVAKDRKRQAIFGQAGNSMHVGVIGPVMLFALTQIPVVNSCGDVLSNGLITTGVESI